MPPLALPSLTASTLKRAAKLMVAALKAKLPPPIVQQLVSNPALLRALVDEMSAFVGGNAMPQNTKRVVADEQLAGLLKKKAKSLQSSFANDLLHELDTDAESDLLEEMLPGDWDVQVEGGRIIIQKQLMMNFADYDDIVEKVARKAKVPESAVRSYVTRDFMYEHMMEMVQYDMEGESAFTLQSGERDHLYVQVPLPKSQFLRVRPTAFARELKALATDRGLIQYVGDETDPDELEELIYQYLNPASDNWAWRKTVDAEPKVASEYKKWAGWIAAYEKDWAKPNRWVEDIIANEYWDTATASTKRTAAVRRSVIAALLKQKRPDLANAVAGVVKAVSDVDVRELVLYIENDGDLYRQQKQPIEKNLTRKWQKGQYDHSKAPKAWMYLVDNGAKKYMKEFGGPGDAFDKATRMAAAQELADTWQAEMEVQYGPMGGTKASTKVRAKKETRKHAKRELYVEIEEGKHGFAGWIVTKHGKKGAPISIPKSVKSIEDAFNSAWQTVKRVSGAKKQVRAGSWEEKAKAELEAELGGIETEELSGGGRDFIRLETKFGRADNGESEWMVFKDYRSAERFALEYLEESIDSDPEGYGDDLLKRHTYVSPTDIRIISGEEADNYVENIREDDGGERILDEAGMLRAYEGMQDKIDKLEDKMTEEMDPKKSDRMQKQIDKLEAAKEKLVDKAADKVHDELYNRTKKQLEDDPMEWAEELGYDFGRNRPNWINVDTSAVAKEILDSDGVGSVLDGYDGDEVELSSGAVAFGTN